MRILVAVDFSESSRGACEWALARSWSTAAQCAGPPLDGDGVEPAEVIFLHVVEPSAVPSSGLGALEQLIGRVRSFVDDIVGEADHPGVRARYTVSRGEPAAEIMAVAAAQRVDAVVMGTHGRRGLDRLLLGSVAESVVRNVPCTVVVVKAPRVA